MWGLARAEAGGECGSYRLPGWTCVPCARRHWQDLGYLILYITGRPDMQKQRVVSWLSQHNFPQGMIFFSDGLVHDPLRQKAIFLRNLVQEVSPRGRAEARPDPDAAARSSPLPSTCSPRLRVECICEPRGEPAQLCAVGAVRGGP